MSKNKLYHLSSCNTCQKIINTLGAENFELINIKEQHIDPKTLDKLAEENGGYEAMFNKRAMKYRSLGLNTQELTEQQFRDQILTEYTFLKRPIAIINGKSFVGNAKIVVESAKAELGN